MKYTTKSGLELPPEVVEVIEQEQNIQGKKDDIWQFIWSKSTQGLRFWEYIYLKDDFTEFYKLYPKKDLDSYGNEIHKGEMVEVRDNDKHDWLVREYFGIADKALCRYLVYGSNYNSAVSYNFCRKITEKQSLKSELQSQMEELLKQAKEIEAKINEL